MPGGLNPPVSVIESWPTANVVNPTLRDNTFIVIILTFLVLSTLIVSARLWARGVIQRSFALDDYLILGAILCTASMGISSCLAMGRFGFNRHVWDAFYDTDMLESGRKAVLSMEVSYIVGTGLTKLSILFFVLRLTRRSSHRWIPISVWCTIIFVTTSTVVFFVLPLVACRPFSAWWHQVNYKWILAGNKFKCIDEGDRVVAAGVVAAIQDIIVASLPLTTIWGLQMPTKKKLAITAIFGGGYLSCAFGIMRLVHTYNTFFQTYDVTWEAPNLFFWTNLELQIALICASIPALKVFLKHYKETTIASKLSYSMGRYRSSASKSVNSQKTPVPQGFYTQAISSDSKVAIKQGIRVTTELSHATDENC